MKFLIVGESCVDQYIYGNSTRTSPESAAPIFIATSQTDNLGQAANCYRNVRSILNQKYKKDQDEVTLITNQKTRDFITKTRYVIERTNTTLLRVDAGDLNYGHISEHYGQNWFYDIKWNDYDCIILSDYDKNFLTTEDIRAIAQFKTPIFLDTKRVLGQWCQNIDFIKVNQEEFDKSKQAIDRDLHNKLIITLGSNGCSYRNNIYPVKSVNVQGISGCGDSFFGALCVSYMKEKDIIKAIKFANKIATLVCQEKGVTVPYNE